MAEKKDWQRLPSTVTPTHYDLKLTPDMRHETVGGTYKFQGEVSIEVKVSAAVQEIKLNAVDLEFKSVSVKQGTNTINAQATVNDDETATLTLDAPITLGTATLVVSYTGTLNDKMKGFYRSVYKAEDGSPRIMATTQFEATDARRALPCWDEPAVKATFTVTMVIPAGLTPVSNMPVSQQSTLPGNLVQYNFERSPIMSTYLLAFVVGEFDMLEQKDSNGILIRVFTGKGKSAQGRFALDCAAKVLPFYTEYFEIPYPLPKLDLLAIPDFSMGAMENWGCVTYRESALLVDDKNTAEHTKQWVALVVCHELAHQWFGNLVTMEWWTHLWLNEGFATWVEYLAVDFLFPDWQIWTQFVNIDLARSLGLDSLKSSHPIEVEVHHPDEVDEIFDAISYSKGSCVIRMLVEYLGQEPFRQGLVKYLKKFTYSNAFTNDLWAALEEHTGKPVKQVMETWTRRIGYPVVHVSAVEEKGDSLTLQAQQVRFLKSGVVAPEDDDSLYNVPISVAVADEKGGATAHFSLLSERAGAVTVPKPSGGFAWLKLNKNQTGHYRVTYPPAIFQKIVNAIKTNDKRLAASDRLGTLDDAFALCQAGITPISQLLELLQAFRSSREYTIWSKMSSILHSLAALLKYTDLYDKFCAWACSVYKDVYAHIGWEKKAGESGLDTMLRTVVIGALHKFKSPEVEAEALSRFARYQAAVSGGGDASAALAPDLRGIAYSAVVGKQPGGFDTVKAIFQTSELNEEQVRALRALAAGSDQAQLRKAWDFFLSDAVRSQDAFIGLCGVIGNRHSSDMASQLLLDNWDDFCKRYGGSHFLGRLVAALGTYNSAAKADEFEAFFQSHEAPAAERQVQQMLEKVRSSASWLERSLPALQTFLA